MLSDEMQSSEQAFKYLRDIIVGEFGIALVFALLARTLR